MGINFLHTPPWRCSGVAAEMMIACALSLIRDHLILPAPEEALFSNDTAVWVMRQVRCRICAYGPSTHPRTSSQKSHNSN